MPGERRLYNLFKERMKEEEPNAWVYKIPDTFGIGGKRPFDTICVIYGVPFAIEFKAEGEKATMYQLYQLSEFTLAGGQSVIYVEGQSSMILFVRNLIKTAKEKK